MSAVEFMDVYCGTKENSDENGNQVATFKAMVEATDGLKPTGME